MSSNIVTITTDKGTFVEVHEDTQEPLGQQLTKMIVNLEGQGHRIEEIKSRETNS